MNEASLATVSEETTIDLRQMFFFILKKWKLLLAALLAGVVLGAGLALFKTEKTLDSFDINEMNIERIRQYAVYHKLYQDQLQYDRGSFLMRMDPNTVYAGTLRYYVTAGKTNIDLICALFQNILYDEALWPEIQEAGQATGDLAYIQELVSLTTSIREEANIQLASADELGRMPAYAIVSAFVLARDEEACEGMMRVLQKYIAAVDAKCKAEYDRYSLQPMTDQISRGYHKGVATMQQDVANLKNEYVTNLKNLEKELSQDELDYFNLAYPALSGQKATASALSRLKYPVLLAALFLFLSAGACAAVYALDKRIKSNAELRDFYGLRLIARLGSGKPARRGIDAWLDKLQRSKAPPYNSREYLLNALRATGAQRILLCGDEADQDVRETMEWLAAKDGGIHSCGLPATDPRALTQARTAGAVVFFVRLWRTNQRRLERDLDICRGINAPVVGAVTVE